MSQRKFNRSKVIVSLAITLFSMNFGAQIDPYAGCKTEPAEWQSMHQMELVLQLGGAAKLSLPTMIADEKHEQRAGYQWICPGNAENTAMLFPFDGMIHTLFHMRNVYVPLAILFFDQSGQLVDSLYMLPEANSEIKPRYYRAKGPFMYALEVAEGFTASRLLTNPKVNLDLTSLQ